MASMDKLSLSILREVGGRDGVDLEVVVGALGGHDEQINDRVKDLLDKGYLTADKVLTGDGTVASAKGLRSTEKGAEAFLDGMEARKLNVAKPATVEEAWSCLLAACEPFSPFEKEVLHAQGDLIQRDMYYSGPSIIETMRLAYAAGLRWDEKRRRFKRPFLVRFRGWLIALAGILATLSPIVFRSKGSSVAEVVSSAATTAAVFVALYSVIRSDRPASSSRG